MILQTSMIGNTQITQMTGVGNLMMMVNTHSIQMT